MNAAIYCLKVSVINHTNIVWKDKTLYSCCPNQEGMDTRPICYVGMCGDNYKKQVKFNEVFACFCAHGARSHVATHTVVCNTVQ